MSNFSPPPTDGQDHCSNGCPNGQTCFLYTGGTICQPFTPPPNYPATGPNATLVHPPAWYLIPSYPSIRYTGSLTNQTQGANCTTVPVPQQSQLYDKLINFVVSWDLGGIYTSLDDIYSSTLLQYRGNCAEGYFCQPSVPTSTTPTQYQGQPITVQGLLPGSCQALRAENDVCQSSVECMGWHIQSDQSYSNDQFRCQPSITPPTTGNWTPTGTCMNQNSGSGVFSPGSYVQKTAKTYLLSTLLLFVLIILYLWYRRQRYRQRERAQAAAGIGMEAGEHGPRGGVYRAPDETDNNELPAYGQHRQDERLVVSDEFGMYPLQSGQTPGGPPPPPISPYGPSSDQHSYPFPMTHPQLNTVPRQPGGTQTPSGVSMLYPPPASDPPPLTAQQAQMAALSAAAAATITTPSSAAVASEARLREGGLLPPAYEPTLSTTVPSAARSGAGGRMGDGETVAGSSPQTDATVSSTTTLGAGAAGAGAVTGLTGTQGEKQGHMLLEDHGQDDESTTAGSSPHLSYSKEKSSVKEKDSDEVSTRTSGSGSGSASASGSGSKPVSRSGSTFK